MATLVQITLRTADGISENFITNQFALTDDVTAGADETAVRDAFDTFYSTLGPDILSSWVAQNNHIIKLYLAGGPQPNYPFYEDTFSLAAAPSGTGLPTEVAVCLSFQGLRIPGTPQARRRGRVYLGALKATVNSNQRPASANITDILDAAEGLYDDLAVIPSAGTWAVWSPTDGSAVPLIEAWVDDSFDTQRSRGQARTTRTTRDLT